MTDEHEEQSLDDRAREIFTALSPDDRRAIATAMKMHDYIIQHVDFTKPAQAVAYNPDFESSILTMYSANTTKYFEAFPAAFNENHFTGHAYLRLLELARKVAGSEKAVEAQFSPEQYKEQMLKAAVKYPETARFAQIT